MNRFISFILFPVLFVSLFLSPALAEPLLIPEDYTGEFRNEETGTVLYSYRFPHVDESAEGGAEINVFYSELVTYTESFTIPMSVDPDEESGSVTTVDYTVTCNNDDYFSVLTQTSRSAFGNTMVFYEGHVFSRKNGSPGLTYTLPKYLGLLEETENDTWLQDRQTAKADALVIDLVWDMLEERKAGNEAGIEFYSDVTRETLSHIFFPEEDYYLDETGNPVFFLQPGDVAPPEAGRLDFPISLQDILDEL